MEAKTDKIRELNDQLRQNFADGIAVTLVSSKLG